MFETGDSLQRRTHGEDLCNPSGRTNSDRDPTFGQVLDLIFDLEVLGEQLVLRSASDPRTFSKRLTLATSPAPLTGLTILQTSALRCPDKHRMTICGVATGGFLLVVNTVVVGQDKRT